MTCDILNTIHHIWYYIICLYTHITNVSFIYSYYPSRSIDPYWSITWHHVIQVIQVAAGRKATKTQKTSRCLRTWRETAVALEPWNLTRFKPWENHGKTMGKWRFHGILWDWPEEVNVYIKLWLQSPFFMGKVIISMAMFNSHVKLPEGIWTWGHCTSNKNRNTRLGDAWRMKPAWWLRNPAPVDNSLVNIPFLGFPKSFPKWSERLKCWKIRETKTDMCIYIYICIYI